MGNAISMNLIANVLSDRKKDRNSYVDPILTIKYCYQCKNTYKDKIKYNEHLSSCKKRDLDIGDI